MSNKGINVLSTFNGMGCIWLALDKVGIKVNKRYSSEIDKYANLINDKNYPDTIQLGDVTKLKAKDLESIDLFVGGSPCQDLRPGRDGLRGDKSKLFYEYYRLLKEVNPTYFLLENVGKISSSDKDIISDLLGVQPFLINSNAFSAQNRKRLYWTNIPNVKSDLPPSDILLKDILEKDIPKKYFKEVPVNYDGGAQLNPSYKSQANTVFSTYKKSPTLCAFSHGYAQGYIKDYYLNDKELDRAVYQYSAKTWKSGNKMGNMKFPDGAERKSKTLSATQIKGSRESHHIQDEYGIRRLTPVEFERLQTVPDNYTEGVSNTQRYKMLGNGWTVDVIAHILKNIK